ncbi:MAG: hypothetical protein K2X69_09195 [Silvanigrellaceae bacterium]|nr:hypothetical protein [Silvanigrellaceae bacterium]
MNKSWHKYIYKQCIIKTAKQHNLLKMLSYFELKKLEEFPEEDIAIIRYLTYFIANNYIGFSEKSKNFKKHATSVNSIIKQSCFIELEIKPFHVLISYILASPYKNIIKKHPLRKNILLNLRKNGNIIHIPFDETFFKETKYFSKKQQIKLEQIGLKRRVDFKNKLRSVAKA